MKMPYSILYYNTKGTYITNGVYSAKRVVNFTDCEVSNCDKTTQYIDMFFKIRVCSADCVQRLWKGFIAQLDRKDI